MIFILENTKKQYENMANLIPNWKQLSKNELFNLCIDCEDNIKRDSYIGAIMCKYWPTLQSLYKKSEASISEDECYDWLVNAVLETIKRKSWRDSTKNIFGDKNGPDKMMNRILKCTRANYYVATNRAKRSLNYNILYIEQLEEDHLEKIIPTIEQDLSSFQIHDYIKQQFEKKEYFLCFITDMIISRESYEANSKYDYTEKLIKHLAKNFLEIDKTYLYQFSEIYEIDIEKVIKAHSYFINLSIKEVQCKVGDTLIRLSRDKNLIKLLT